MIECEFLKDGVCKKAEELCGLPVLTNDEACKACLGSDNPKGLNIATASICVRDLARADDLDRHRHKHLLEFTNSPAEDCDDCGKSPTMGVGTELGEIIPKLFNRKGCGCKSYAAKMDRWGIAGCIERKEEIVDYLVEQAKGWSIPAIASRWKANEWVDLAIENAKKSWPFVWTYYEAGAKGDELKYSIRSVLKHMPDAKVVVIGDKPSWYTGEFIESPRIDPTDFHSFKDCYTKLLRACDHHDKFIWMMDDVYWVRPFTIRMATTPKYVRHVSQEKFYAWKPKNAWAKTRARAYSFLLDNNLPTYDFAAHLPQPIRAKTFKEMESKLGILEDYRNWECVYYNTFYSYQAQDWGRRFTRVTKTVNEVKTKHVLLNHTDSKFRGAVERFLQRCLPDRCGVEA